MSNHFKAISLHLMVGSLLMLSSCNDRALDRFTITESFKQEKQRKIDVLWIVDNSVSMDEENPLVQAGSSAFINAIVNSNADFQLGVLTMNIQSQVALGSGQPDQAGLLQAPTGITSILSSESPSANVVNAFKSILQYVQTDPVAINALGKGCEAGLEAAKLAVDPSLNLNDGLVRDDAHLAIIFLTDEDDASTNPNTSNDTQLNDGCDSFSKTLYTKTLSTVDEYLNFFQTLKSGNYSINGIITLAGALSCGQLEGSSKFEEAIDATNGFKADICLDDYSTFLDDLGLQIANLSSKFTLMFPADAATLVVKVNGVTLDASGYTLAEDKESIILATPPDLGDTVEISYLVDTFGLTLVN